MDNFITTACGKQAQLTGRRPIVTTTEVLAEDGGDPKFQSVAEKEPSLLSIRLAAERLSHEFTGVSLISVQHDLIRRTEAGRSINEAEAEVREVLRRTDDLEDETIELTPIPIPALPWVPKLDLRILPSSLRGYVSDCAIRRSSPVEYVAVSILTALGSVIGTKVGVQPKRNDFSFFLFPNLYALLIGPSGVKKSDCIKDGLQFLDELEREVWDDYKRRKPEIDAAATERKLEIEALEIKIKKSYIKLSKADEANIDRRIWRERLAELKAFRLETAKRLIIQDSTIEKTGILLNENPNGLLAYHDEIAPLLDQLSHKEKQKDRGFYLRAANGTGTEIIDRVGREDLHIKNTCLSVVGGTQPARISSLAEATVRLDGDDGLLPRFGLAVWPDVPEFCYVDSRPKGVAEARRVFRSLYLLDPSQFGFGVRGEEHWGQYFLSFGLEANEFFTKWLITHQTETRRAFGTYGTDIPASHLSKYAGLMPKLALIFQLVDLVTGLDTGNEISLKNAEMAAEWIEFLKAHAVRLYAQATKPEFRRALAVIERIREGDLARIFSARELYRKHWKDLTDQRDVMKAIEVLIDYQWLRELRVGTGGRAATRYVFADIDITE